MSLERTLGFSARSIYVQMNDNETMLSRSEADSGGGAAVEAKGQKAIELEFILAIKTNEYWRAED